jgi:hypothetical protein
VEKFFFRFRFPRLDNVIICYSCRVDEEKSESSNSISGILCRTFTTEATRADDGHREPEINTRKKGKSESLKSEEKSEK